MSYQYTPLREDQIRLLKLSPRHSSRLKKLFSTTDPAPLSGDLVTVHIDPSGYKQTRPPFEAISYVWGSDVKPNTIKTPIAQLPLTVSLYSLLDRLRLDYRERWIWADAICINQDDTAEKGQQVAMMPAIYKAAKRVIVDLGAEEDDSDMALELLDLFWMTHIWSGIAMPSSNALDAEGTAKMLGINLGKVKKPTESLPPLFDAKWECVRKFWARPWFHRVWIIQEFVLAREISMICGKREVDWRHLFASTQGFVSGGSAWFDRQVEQKSFYGMSTYTRMAFLRTMRISRKHAKQSQYVKSLLRQAKSDNPNDEDDTCYLATLVTSFRQSQVKLQRDRYFAMLGIAEDIKLGEIVPDYTCDDSVIVKQFGKLLIKGRAGPEALLFAGLVQSAAATIPSWTLDFSLQDVHTSGVPSGSYTSPNFVASGGLPFVVDVDSRSEDIILVRGKKIDTIAAIPFGKPEFPKTNPEARLDFSGDRIYKYASSGLSAFLRARDDNDLITRSSAKEHPLQAACRTLCHYTGSNDDDLKTLMIGFCYLLWVDFVPDGTPLARVSAAFEPFFQGISASSGVAKFAGGIALTLLHDFQPMVTRGGRCAMVPRITKPGDEVWVLQGCPVPFIMRPSEARNRMFQLVGTCFCLGVMDGECLDWDGQAFVRVFIH